MPKEIHVSEPISIAEAKELLMKRYDEAKEKKEELSYMQSIALDHAISTTRTTGADARKVINELIEKFRISNLGAISLANTLPDTIDEVRQILDPESKKMETETIEEILKILNKAERVKPDFSKIEYPSDEDEFEKEFEDEKEIPSDIPEDLL
jgi:DNA-directed RNA polymerase subunit F